MRVVGVVVTLLIALTLQMALARYAVGDRWVFDLVLVGVVYVAFYWGPAAGMIAGSLGGVIQDALAGDIVGVGGLAKTVAGGAAGLASQQFVVARPLGRMAAVAVLSLSHRLFVLGLYAVIDQRWPDVSATGMLVETVLNAASALIAFQATDALPGAVRHSRDMRRSSLSRRRW